MRTALISQPLSHHRPQLYDVPYTRISGWGWRSGSLGKRGCLVHGMRTLVQIQDSYKNPNAPITPELWRWRQGDCGDLLAANLTPDPGRNPGRKRTEKVTGCPPTGMHTVWLEAPTQPCLIYRAPFLSSSLQTLPGSESLLIRNHQKKKKISLGN